MNESRSGSVRDRTSCKPSSVERPRAWAKGVRVSGLFSRGIHIFIGAAMLGFRTSFVLGVVVVSEYIAVHIFTLVLFQSRHGMSGQK